MVWCRVRADRLNARNLGAACKLFRVRYTNESQIDFAVKYDMSVSNLCGFENGYVLSMKCFLAYIHEGLMERLFEMQESDINEEVEYQKSAREYKAARKAAKAGE